MMPQQFDRNTAYRVLGVPPLSPEGRRRTAEAFRVGRRLEERCPLTFDSLLDGVESVRSRPRVAQRTGR